jgi:hypothetical protein
LRIPAGWSRRKPIVMVVAAHIAVGFAGEAMPLRQRLGLCVDHGTNLGRSVFAYLDRGASRGHDATLSTEHNVSPCMDSIYSKGYATALGVEIAFSLLDMTMLAGGSRPARL